MHFLVLPLFLSLLLNVIALFGFYDNLPPKEGSIAKPVWLLKIAVYLLSFITFTMIFMSNHSFHVLVSLVVTIVVSIVCCIFLMVYRASSNCNSSSKRALICLAWGSLHVILINAAFFMVLYL